MAFLHATTQDHCAMPTQPKYVQQTTGDSDFHQAQQVARARLARLESASFAPQPSYQHHLHDKIEEHFSSAEPPHRNPKDFTVDANNRYSDQYQWDQHSYGRSNVQGPVVYSSSSSHPQPSGGAHDIHLNHHRFSQETPHHFTSNNTAQEYVSVHPIVPNQIYSQNSYQTHMPSTDAAMSYPDPEAEPPSPTVQRAHALPYTDTVLCGPSVHPHGMHSQPGYYESSHSYPFHGQESSGIRNVAYATDGMHNTSASTAPHHVNSQRTEYPTSAGAPSREVDMHTPLFVHSSRDNGHAAEDRDYNTGTAVHHNGPHTVNISSNGIQYRSASSIDETPSQVPYAPAVEHRPAVAFSTNCVPSGSFQGPASEPHGGYPQQHITGSVTSSASTPYDWHFDTPTYMPVRADMSVTTSAHPVGMSAPVVGDTIRLATDQTTDLPMACSLEQGSQKELLPRNSAKTIADAHDADTNTHGTATASSQINTVEIAPSASVLLPPTTTSAQPVVSLSSAAQSTATSVHGIAVTTPAPAQIASTHTADTTPGFPAPTAMHTTTAPGNTRLLATQPGQISLGNTTEATSTPTVLSVTEANAVAPTTATSRGDGSAVTSSAATPLDRAIAASIEAAWRRNSRADASRPAPNPQPPPATVPGQQGAGSARPNEEGTRTRNGTRNSTVQSVTSGARDGLTVPGAPLHVGGPQEQHRGGSVDAPCTALRPINIPGTTKGWLPAATATKKRVFKALRNPEDQLNNDLSRALGDIGVFKPPQQAMCGTTGTTGNT
eukprot:m.326439 g.326439  ORF g.326439 m.326439 type:complete len:776 (-) comp20405_c0_seq2:132-2459(-)